MARAEAILALCDDPDPTVRGHLADDLIRDPALLDEVWSAALRAGEPPGLLCDLALRADQAALLAAWSGCGLEDGCWILAHLWRPRTDHAAAGRAALDALAARLPAGADAGIVARVLGQEFGFAGDAADYDNPLNSYLPAVLERRCGLPIALTVLWLLVCRRRGLNAWPVALPGHVVGRWEGGYVDPFAQGRAVSRAALERHCRALGAHDPAAHLGDADDRAILQRMARNLVASHLKRGDRLRAGLAQALAG